MRVEAPARSRDLSWRHAALLVLALAMPQLTSAQAWLPSQGTFGAAMTYNDVLNLHHYLPNGDELDAGHTRTDTIGFGVAYSPTDRLMLTASVPYVMTRYWGDHPHPGTDIDDGDEHKTLTDLRVAAHYQLLREPFALAPYISYVTPVKNYETFGHSAPGRGLNELWLGFGIGKNLNQWLPRTYVQARYNYAFVEKVADVKHDNSNLDLELGYFITRQWSVRAMSFMRFAHGGIDVPIPPSNPLFPHHDQLAASTFKNVGLGGSYEYSPNLSFYAMYLTSLSGTDGHELDQGVTLGVNFGFTPLRERIEQGSD